MSEIPDDVQAAWKDLRRLTVDLVFDRQPESEEHLALRRAAVATVRAWFLERE